MAAVTKPTADAANRLGVPVICSCQTQMVQAMTAAAAGDGRPVKLAMSLWVLKRARRRGGAGDVQEGEHPSHLAQAGQAPGEHHESRRDAEGHEVGEAVVLRPEVALGTGEPGDAAIGGVERNGGENRQHRSAEAAVHAGDDGIESGKQRTRGDDVGQQVDAPETGTGRPVSSGYRSLIRFIDCPQLGFVRLFHDSDGATGGQDKSIVHSIEDAESPATPS